MSGSSDPTDAGATAEELLVSVSGPLAEALPFPASAVDLELFTGRGSLRGYSFFASGGAACQLQLIDGSKSTDQIVAEIQIASGATATQSLPSPGVLIARGILVHVIAGTPRGVVYTIPFG